ncbi:LIC13259/LIC11441 family protein [Leptospira idonii]|uniref:Uncharacterized protein n=1 Tax=Leptospira idonii TaxID=1193500 RepID=A0A4R9M4V0_9LEPT|nr:hypothetical protein [Leptospira idonii]TGN20855.1 hypothetical protein EHS15_01295 [Leptospira idonii]
MRSLFTYIVASSVIGAPVEEKLLERLHQFQKNLSSTQGPVNTTGIVDLVKRLETSALESKVLVAKILVFAEELEKETGRESQERLYSSISSILKDRAPHFRFHVLTCPVTKKTWIAKGETGVNPYLLGAEIKAHQLS